MIDSRGHHGAGGYQYRAAGGVIGRATARMPIPWPTLGRSLRDRILPALLTAAGVTLLAAGLLTYTGSPVAADPLLRDAERDRPSTRRPASPC